MSFWICLRSYYHSHISSLMKWILGLAFGLLLDFDCSPPPPPFLPDNPYSPCHIAPIEFSSWFEPGLAQPSDVVKPANSITFAGNNDCDFLKWSERMFLWLTSPAPPSYGGGGGRIFRSPVFFDVPPTDEDHNFVSNLIDIGVNQVTELTPISIR